MEETDKELLNLTLNGGISELNEGQNDYKNQRSKLWLQCRDTIWPSWSTALPLFLQGSNEQAALKTQGGSMPAPEKAIWTSNSCGPGQFNVSLLWLPDVMTANPNTACKPLRAKQGEHIMYCRIALCQPDRVWTVQHEKVSTRLMGLLRDWRGTL